MYGVRSSVYSTWQTKLESSLKALCIHLLTNLYQVCQEYHHSCGVMNSYAKYLYNGTWIF